MKLAGMINGVAVSLFGMLLSASFCDVLWTKKRKQAFIITMVLILALQGLFFLAFDYHMVQLLYPILVHVPLIIALTCFTGKIGWSVTAVLTAYLCCYIRRWLALLICTVFSSGFLVQYIAEIAVTVPLLIVLIKMVAPSIRFVSNEKVSIQLQFALVPIIGYLFDYLTQIYKEFFETDSLAVVEFMPFLCSVVFLVFVAHLFREKQEENYLRMRIEQAGREISLLREVQDKTRTYRHDLRHHMQYLLSCIEHERYEKAGEYIRNICQEVEESQVQQYCANETINLILSMFAGRALTRNVRISIRAEVPQDMRIEEKDLCVLLSNVLENALHACEKTGGEITVLMYEKHTRFFVEVQNDYAGEIVFANGVPVTDRKGHGLGVHSICTLIKKYKGIYSFSVKDDKFVFRASI